MLHSQARMFGGRKQGLEVEARKLGAGNCGTRAVPPACTSPCSATYWLVIPVHLVKLGLQDQAAAGRSQLRLEAQFTPANTYK